jgi:hypothetical protein
MYFSDCIAVCPRQSSCCRGGIMLPPHCLPLGVAQQLLFLFVIVHSTKEWVFRSIIFLKEIRGQRWRQNYPSYISYQAVVANKTPNASQSLHPWNPNRRSLHKESLDQGWADYSWALVSGAIEWSDCGDPSVGFDAMGSVYPVAVDQHWWAIFHGHESLVQ